MTCIVGVISADGVVHLGADSASSDGHRISATRTPKLAELVVDAADCEGGRARVVLGFTTSWRMGQVLQQSALPAIPRGMDPFEYVVRLVVPQVRAALKDAGFATVANGVETGGTWLVGLGGRLFTVQNDYAVLENAEPYAACGSGTDYALGALWGMTLRHGAPCEAIAREVALDLIGRALEAAETFVTTVRGPFHFVSTEPEGVSR